MEACAFRDAQAQFESAKTVVIGISGDSVADQAKFAEKFGLPFRLLADTDHRVAEAYGAWVEKTNYGKKYMGIQRSTFIIGPDGTLVKEFPKVTSIEDHPQAVLEALSRD